MIEAEHTLVIDAAIDDVWNYVQDISKWANLFPGCRDCEIIDDDNSRWTLKVGAGGMVKTVNVLVHVDQWDGPGRVDFSYRLESEPVVGSGSYSASRKSDIESEVGLQVRVEGRGQMAAMWEAMCKPLLPQMAKTFSDRLKTEIEALVPAAVPTPAARPSLVASLAGWLRNVWWALLGSPTEKASRDSGDMARMEQNKSVVLTFIDAMSTSNAALADTCVAPDAFTVAKGYGKFAGVRTRETMIGTIDAFKELLPTGLKVEVKSVTADGNVVVVEFEGDATTRDGKPYQNQYCMVFMLAEGKIKQVNEYFCNVHADEVLWPLVEQHSADNG
jgi:ketosteroid isomerase-like protein/carbon monoxide dehydrogenase subunit G